MAGRETIQIDVASEKLLPLLEPHTFKGAHGGRGGTKSYFFADMHIARALRQPGYRALCLREVQKSIKESSKHLLEERIQAHGVGHLFRILDQEIRTPGGGQLIFHGLKDHTAESIKSFEGFDVADIEEGQTISQRSLDLLIPTIIRKPGAEIWARWNPRNKSDPIDRMFRGGNPPPDSVCVEVCWQDNPWISDEMKRQIEADYEENPDKAEHIWGGGYEVIREGAYYSDLMIKARKEGRICHVPYDPAAPVNTFWDLGMNDQTTIWFHQQVGKEHRFIDYYTNEGEGFAHYAKTIKELPYIYDRHYLPHDAEVRELTTGKHRREVLEALGVRPVDVVPRIGQINEGIEMVRQVLPLCWFDEEKCGAGIECLEMYRREFDEKLGTFKARPLHDYASHGADSFRQFAQGYKGNAGWNAVKKQSGRGRVARKPWQGDVGYRV